MTMTEYGTIKIPREEYEKHNKKREENNQTWAQYINGQAPETPGDEIDYAEIEKRCESAVKSTIPEF